MTARISPQTGSLPPALQSFLNRMERSGVEPLVLFRTLGRSERAWLKFSGGSLLDAGSPLSLRDRELVIHRTCARTGCEYEWGVHAQLFAQHAGLSEADLSATLSMPLDRDRWPVSEAALLTAVDALCERSTLNDGEYEGLARHFSEEQILEILQLCGFYHQVAFLANALALPLEKRAPRFRDHTFAG